MGIYPVTVRVKPYRGSDSKKLEKLREKIHFAKILEEHINSKMKDKEIHKFTYGFMSSELAIPKEIISELLSTIDGGSNGVTVCTKEHWKKNFSENNA